MLILPEQYRVPIFNLIKNCYTQTCNDLVSLNSESTNQLSSDLKKVFYFYNKKQYSQLKGLHESIYKITWSKLVDNGSWEHICLRESFIIGQLAGITYYYIQNDYNKTLELCDTTFIMGGLKELIIPLMNELSTKLKQQQQQQQDTTTTTTITNEFIIPNENINFELFPMINQDVKFQIKVLEISSKSITDVGYQDEFQLFKNEYLDKQIPCIIKFDASNWECINKWKDLNYFSSNHGNRIVPIELAHNKLDSLKVKQQQEQEQEQEQEQQLDWSEKIMKLNEFITTYMIPSSKDINNGINTSSSKVAYLAQHALIEQLPTLSSDFKLPLFLQSINDKISPHMWFGTGNTITPLHFDSNDNFLAQIVGYKYVRLYPSNQSPNLYINNGNANKNSKTSQNNISLVDIEYPDLNKYPLLKTANQYYTEAIIKPGEILFMPSGYFHYVRSLSTSCSLSFFFSSINK